jgi:glycosyltransferase involved in cell wall biosynthesis
LANLTIRNGKRFAKNFDMKISIIIPAYNEENYIRDCLEAVQKNAGGVFEVIVVDNASTDKTAEIAKSFPFIRVVDQPQKGLLWARQKGFEEAKGELLAYIDCDCHIGPNWLVEIAKEFGKDPKLVSLSGPYRYYDLPPVYNFFANLSWWLSAPFTYRIVGYMVLGGNFVVKKEIVEKIGGFNTNISFYGEDTDLARRLSPYGKVKFKMNFFVRTSGRRLLQEGLLKTFWVYGLNFLWEVIFKKPLTKSHENIR